MKKFWAILLAVMLVLSMVTVASATEVVTPGFTITVKPNDGATHTYEVYQIFVGDVTVVKDEENKTESTILTNVKWGENAANSGADVVVGDDVPEDVLSEIMAAKGSNQEKLAVITLYVNLKSTPVDSFTSTKAENGKSKPLTSGYYLVKDKDTTLDGAYGAYSTMMVQVLESNIEISAKSEYPSVDKQVQDEVGDAEMGNTNGWGESADHALFEEFDFRLVATLPANKAYDDYEKYAIKFTDTMSKGVTFVAIKSVTVNGIEINAGEGDDEYKATATAGQAGGSWTLTIPDLKKIGKETDNPLNISGGVTIEVIYTAYLNENAQVFNDSAEKTENENSISLEYSNNPNAEGMGKTTEDHVWLFTYVVNNTKYQNDVKEGNELANAGFTLYVDLGSNQKQVVPLLKKTGVEGTYYVYDGDVAKIPNGYEQVKNNEMITAADGKFNIVGLDHGSYILEETTTPAGFNALDPFKFSVSATHAEATDGNSASMTLSNNSKETMNNNIVNKSGAQLPETGGIGTTIFYVLGGMMFVGAALILVVRRKAEADEN